MSDGISDGRYKIVSLTKGNPCASIDGRSRLRFQFVHLNGPGAITTWGVKKEGPNPYRLSVGAYPYTGVANDGVIVSMDSELDVQWIATCSEDQGAYTVAPADDPNKGWTVRLNDEGGPVLEIKPIVSTTTDPPQFLPSQLFQFVRDDE